jgi:predicted anti-sigma-YlaC factor YlaD
MASRLCEHARRHLSDLIDDQPIPLLDRVLVRFHLRLCPTCKNVRRSLDATRDALGALRDEDREVDGRQAS